MRACVCFQRLAPPHIGTNQALILPTGSYTPPTSTDRDVGTAMSSSQPSTTSNGPSTPVIQHALPSFSAPRDPSTSSLVTPYCLALSLPHPPNADPFIDALPYQLLLAEMPSALRHSSRRAIKRRRKLMEEVEETGLVVDGLNGAARREDKEEETELEARLEQVGALIGANLAER